MENTDRHESSSPSLDSLLNCTVRDDPRESRCCFEAKQLFFWLSGEHVHLFYLLLKEAQARIKLPHSTQNEENPSSANGKKVREKIFFISHDVHAPFPAHIELTTLNFGYPAKCVESHEEKPFQLHIPRDVPDSLNFELSSAELEDLLIEVMFLAFDLKMDEAVWVLASHFSGGDCHLVRKDGRNRRGSVLCGCFPPSPSQKSDVSGWMFLPVTESLIENDSLCPTCLHLWKTELLKVSQPIEQSISIQNR